MSEVYQTFIKKSAEKAFDEKHRKTIKFNISKYEAALPKGRSQYSNIELAKKRASSIKTRVVNDLDKYLIEFEASFTKRGGKIVWARDASEAISEILKIANREQAKKIVKSKSMITEEIELNHHLEKNGIESLETDLGEYIVQLDDDKPYHIVTPVMHKSKEDIAEIFNRKFDLPIDSTPESITAFVRTLLREKFTSADIGITGANFIIADVGAIGLTENEGNGVMSMSFPKVHIAIVGMEKLIPSFKDLALFWPLLSSHGTGQKVTVYNSIVGPKQENETDGPEQMYVVLLDNGRTNLLKQSVQRKALTCIRCGSCLNACPVYKNIGGHAYGTVYSGPIGAVITPHLKGVREYNHLSYASSLCGRCSEKCPMKIPLHKLLLYNRKDTVKGDYSSATDKLVQYGWKTAMLHRWMIDFTGHKTKNFMIKSFFKKAWGPHRNIPVVKPKSFNQAWREKHNID